LGEGHVRRHAEPRRSRVLTEPCFWSMEAPTPGRTVTTASLRLPLLVTLTGRRLQPTFLRRLGQATEKPRVVGPTGAYPAAAAAARRSAIA